MTRQIDAARDRVVLLETPLEESHDHTAFASGDARGRTVRQRDAAADRVTSAFENPTMMADCERGTPNSTIL
jgi:hypothetical protein